ncbi:MAG: hypothetical protein EOP53_08850 [Sphingobacteriales bacterium]|nr:MAG: hypothetical protein EOP53_08850 [Sphingobacteriales bacterium]
MDFYIIEDSQPKPNPTKIHELEYLGKLSDEEFYYLQNQKIIEDRFDYYKDLRWSKNQVKEYNDRLFKLISSKIENNNVKVENFYKMLKQAYNFGSGIIGYAD